MAERERLENIDWRGWRWEVFKFDLFTNPSQLFYTPNGGLYPEYHRYARFERYWKFLESVYMAKKPQKRFTEIEFVNYRLEGKEKAAFKVWYQKNSEQLVTLIINTIASGYKNSCSFSRETETWTSALTCQEEGNPNHNQCLTSRAGDYWEAQALNIYKHLELSEGGIWAFEKSDMNWG